MGVMTDATGRLLVNAVGGVDTTGLAKDSTLQAVNSSIQAGNNELSAIKDAINALSFTDLFKVKTYTYSWTWSSGARELSITASDFNAQAPDGYTPLTISRISIGALYAYLRAYNANATGTTSMLAIYYSGSGAITATATLVVVYVKSGAIS